MGFNVVRFFCFLEEAKNGITFQYWDPTRSKNVVNATGLIQMDYALSQASILGLKVIISLANNWKEEGGVPAYLSWFGMTDSQSHDKFFTDPRLKQ